MTFVDLQSRLGSCSGSGVRPHRMGRVPARMRPGPAALRSVSARRKSTAFPPKMATTTLAIARIIQESSSYYGNPLARANGPLGAAEPPQWAVVTVSGCPSVPLIPLLLARGLCRLAAGRGPGSPGPRPAWNLKLLRRGASSPSDSGVGPAAVAGPEPGLASRTIRTSEASWAGPGWRLHRDWPIGQPKAPSSCRRGRETHLT